MMSQRKWLELVFLTLAKRRTLIINSFIIGISFLIIHPIKLLLTKLSYFSCVVYLCCHIVDCVRDLCLAHLGGKWCNRTPREVSETGSLAQFRQCHIPGILYNSTNADITNSILYQFVAADALQS